MTASRRPHQRGYAMILALIITMVISTMTLGLVASGRAGLEGSRELLGRGESRALAGNGLEDFFARVQSTPGFAEAVLADAGVAATTSFDLQSAHPGYTPAADRATAPRWASFSGGVLSPCPADLRTDCFTVSALADQQSGVGEVTSAVIDVTSRVRCAGVESRCIYTRIQQRVRQSQFFDYLSFHQYSTLDPLAYDCTAAPCANGTVTETQPRTNVHWVVSCYRPGPVVPFAGNIADTNGYTCGSDRSCTWSPGPDITYCVFGVGVDDSGWVADPPPPGFVDNGTSYVRSITVWPSTLNPATDCADKKASARPAGCLDIAYSGSAATGFDVIDGPIYTADDRIVLCGDPDFPSTPGRRSDITVAGPGASGQAWAAAATVGATVTCPATTPAAAPSGTVNAPTLEMPSRASTLAAAISIADPSYAISGNATVTLQASAATTTLSIDGGPPMAMPEPAVLAVTGNATVHGTVAGRLSIFAGGDITIDGDITYANGANSSNTRDVLALAAGRSIIVTQNAAYADRTIHAVLMAVSGSVFVEDWVIPQSVNAAWTAALADNTAPALHLYGSIASKYQGVFGLLNPSNGALMSGYVKDFRFDDRLSDGSTTPAYVISPTERSWVRLPVNDAAVDVQAP